MSVLGKRPDSEDCVDRTLTITTIAQPVILTFKRQKAVQMEEER